MIDNKEEGKFFCEFCGEETVHLMEKEAGTNSDAWYCNICGAHSHRVQYLNNIPATTDLEEEWIRETSTVFKIFKTKNRKYTPQNISMAGPTGVVGKLNDKMQRLWNLVINNEPATSDETLEDTVRDIADYGIILMLVLKKIWPKPQKPKVSVCPYCGTVHINISTDPNGTIVIPIEDLPRTINIGCSDSVPTKIVSIHRIGDGAHYHYEIEENFPTGSDRHV